MLQATAILEQQLFGLVVDFVGRNAGKGTGGIQMPLSRAVRWCRRAGWTA